jgi:hypothetical protein
VHTSNGSSHHIGVAACQQLQQRLSVNGARDQQHSVHKGEASSAEVTRPTDKLAEATAQLAHETVRRQSTPHRCKQHRTAVGSCSTHTTHTQEKRGGDTTASPTATALRPRHGHDCGSRDAPRHRGGCTGFTHTQTQTHRPKAYDAAQCPEWHSDAAVATSVACSRPRLRRRNAPQNNRTTHGRAQGGSRCDTTSTATAKRKTGSWLLPQLAFTASVATHRAACWPQLARCTRSGRECRAR